MLCIFEQLVKHIYLIGINYQINVLRGINTMLVNCIQYLIQGTYKWGGYKSNQENNRSTT